MYHIEKPFHKLVKKVAGSAENLPLSLSPLPMGDDRGKKEINEYNKLT